MEQIHVTESESATAEKTSEKICREYERLIQSAYMSGKTIPSVAEEYLRNEIDMAREAKDYGLYLTVSNLLADFYHRSAMPDSAISVLEDILLLMEELQMEDTDCFAAVLTGMAAINTSAGRYYEAIAYQKRALAVFERIDGSLKEQARIHTGLSLLYLTLQKVPACAPTENESLSSPGAYPEYTAESVEAGFTRAAELFEKSDSTDDPYYSAALSGLGESAFRRGAYAEALKYYEACYRLNLSSGSTEESLRILAGNRDAAAAMAQKCIEQ